MRCGSKRTKLQSEHDPQKITNLKQKFQQEYYLASVFETDFVTLSHVIHQHVTLITSAT